MDSLTHIVLGACIGEAVAGKKLGKKGMLWGAIAQTIPDFDFVASFWLTMDKNLLAHRGFTHSVFFALPVVPILALLAYRWHKKRNISWLAWVVFFAIEIICHLFIDTFNNYGIGWLEPFSKARFSFNTLYVIDPFFTIIPLVAAIVLWIKRTDSAARKTWWKIGIVVPAAYLMYCTYNKIQVNRAVKNIMQQQHISYNRYFTTPTPFNSWLWYVVAANDSGLYAGYRSVFDSKDTIHFYFFERNERLLSTVTQAEELASIQNLKRFSQGFYTIQQWNDTLVFNDLRFGQITGWYDPDEKFVFHYYIRHKGNTTAVQRGRFARWNTATIRSLIERIKGN